MLPVFVGEDTPGRLRWQLMVINAANTKDFRTLDTRPLRHGQRAGRQRRRRPAGVRRPGGEPLSLGPCRRPSGASRNARPPVVSLCFSRRRPHPGRRHVGRVARAAESQLQVWDVPSRRIMSTAASCRTTSAPARSVPDGKRLAYTGGKDNEVFVAPLRDPEKTVALAGTGRRILKVAFAKEEPFYRVAFGTDYRDRGFNDYADLQESFDTTRSSLVARCPVASVRLARRRLVAGRLAGEAAGRRHAATVRRRRAQRQRGPRSPPGRPAPLLLLDRRSARASRLPLPSEPTCKTASTSTGWSSKGPCPMLAAFPRPSRLRHFAWRSPATCGFSPRLRPTARSWSGASRNISGARKRWAAGAPISRSRDRATGRQDARPGRPAVPQGSARGRRDHGHPLAGRAGRIARRSRPAAILEALQTVPWATQVVFESSRGGAARPPFQLLPAWQPLATLFVATERRMGLLDAGRLLRRLDERLPAVRLAGEPRPARAARLLSRRPVLQEARTARRAWTGCCRREVCTRRSAGRRPRRPRPSCTRSCPSRSPPRRR